jgi:hypothetical protein
MKIPVIDSFSFGKIIIDGETYQKDLIITGSRVLPNWWRKQGHALCLADINPILKFPPQVLVVGSGVYGRVKLEQLVIKEMNNMGIRLIVQNTEDACQSYNSLSINEKVAAALHLTC